MSAILCIETASTNCSVAIGVNGKLLALKEDYSDSFSHAERLHIFIQELLSENNVNLQEIKAVAVSKGPGSYTGLRIGVSAAKGLCFSLGIPLISVATLSALARQIEQPEEFIVPMLDARRMEVYAAVFDKEYKQVKETAALVLSPDSFTEFLEKGKVQFIGSGVAKFRTVCDHPNASFIEAKLPSAGEMIPLAAKKFDAGEFEDVAYFEPYYLKDFIAG